VVGAFTITGRITPSTDPDFGVSAVCLQINGQKPTSGTYGYNNNLVNSNADGCFGVNDEEPDWSFDVSSWKNGDYTFTFYAIDNNKALTDKTSLTVKVLNTDPVASFISPKDKATVQGKFTLKGEVVRSNRNNNSISKICLKINGKAPTSGTLSGNYLSGYTDENSCTVYGVSTTPAWSFDSTTWANGSYTFTFSANDSSGRVSNTVTQSVTVANQSPVVAFTSPAASSTVQGKFTLKGTAAASSEGTASIYKICLKINGKTPTSGTLEGNSMSNYSDDNSCMTYGASTIPNWFFDTTTWTNGSYTFTFSALDTSGRESNEVSRVLTVRN
jgi:hypothetical protein